MRTTALRFAILMILALTANVVEAQDQELTVSDKEDSGCLRVSDYEEEEEEEVEPIQTIILEKEGNILSVQLLNFTSNCATSEFEVSSRIDEGSDDEPCTLFIDAVPVGDEQADCICQFNVSFTIHDVEPNTFYLDCWWYEGLVELTEGEPLVLADVYEDATIDGMNYTLRKAFRQATVAKCNRTGELCIPTEVSYEGQTYSVTSIDADAFRNNTALTKDKLLSEVWGAFSEVEPKTLAVHIRWLREKLEDNPAEPQYIKTVYKVGYILEAEI